MTLTTQGNTYIVKIKKDEIDKIDFAQCAQPTQTLDAFYQKQSVKPDVLINGGLFAFATGKSVMDFIDEGKIQSVEDWIFYGMGIDYAGNMLYGRDNETAWKDFISAYPPLVVNGQKAPVTMASEISGKNRRTILGYDKIYIYIIIISTATATLNEAADIVLNTGCQYAINLDGGGSTRMLYQGKVYAAANYNRPVDNVVAVYLKKEAQQPQKENNTNMGNTTTINGFRVQVGAFPTKQGANDYATKVKAASAEFSNTIVKNIPPYYKVYSGAFEKKTDADAYMKKIISKGFSAFVIADTIEVNENNTSPVSPTPSTPATTPSGFTNSSLAVVKIISPNKTANRKHAIDRITPHCVVGQCTAEALGTLFQNSSRSASSNYGVDKDGRIGLYVEEKDRSWCSSSTANDDRAVTIECASDTYHPYKFTDKCYESLVKLCVDICKRYNKTKLIWLKDKDVTLAYEPKANEMVLTVHRWFANKACPGDWLYERLDDLASRVTTELAKNSQTTTPTQPIEEDVEMTQSNFNKMMDVWLTQQAKLSPADWSAAARKWAESNGYIKGDENGNKMYKKPVTREELVQMLYNIKG